MKKAVYWKEIDGQEDESIVARIERGDKKYIKGFYLRRPELLVVSKGGDIISIIKSTDPKEFTGLFDRSIYDYHFIDPSPTTLKILVKGQGADSAEISGLCHFTYWVKEPDAPKLSNFKESILREADLEEKISKELSAAIFPPIIKNYKKDEVYGNEELVTKIADKVRVELNDKLGMFGLSFYDLKVEWYLGEEFARDIAEIEKLIELQRKAGRKAGTIIYKSKIEVHE